MTAASPTPMGSSHFPSISRRPSSRQTYRSAALKLQQARNESNPEAHGRHYSLNDSSDDEIPQPMKFSALTKALLNDEPSLVEKSPSNPSRKSPGHSGIRPETGPAGIESPNQARVSPSGSHSPYPRRVVRLSGTPGSSTLRKTSYISSAVRRQNEESASRPDNEVDLSTPAHASRPVRAPITSTLRSGVSGSSAGRYSSRTNSASRTDEREAEPQEHPSTAAKAPPGTGQVGTAVRTRYGEDSGLPGSMRIKRAGKLSGSLKVSGSLLSGPARRGRRRLDDEEQSPLEGQSDGLEAGSGQDPQSQLPQAPESRDQDQEANRASLYSSTYRDFASGSPVSSKDIINTMLRSNSPPPPTLASAQKSSTKASESRPAAQPSFKVPAPRPDLPSAHDQENEAPPTFKRNKQAPLLQLDKLEKAVSRPQSIDLSAMRAVSPERRPLAPRSQNTPHRSAPPPPKMSILETATSTAGAATASHATSKKNRLRVNGKQFTRLDCIGRGGSSRVYRVMAENSNFFALKRVSLEDADEMAVRGFKGEIDLLKKLETVDRVIRLYDYELNEEKGTLSVLMEMGELDMNKILELRLKSDHAKFDVSFVRHYWKEMLECLAAIHAHDVVHSDLKPHNFVLVKGRLKLIDFGIANAIQTDETVNVHRETQIGTPNYMSPESLMDSNAKPETRAGRIAAPSHNEPKLMKLGKPSDVWSLGCILYQMVYGRAPFAHIANQMQRCQAIINFNYAIEYPSTGVGGVRVPASLIRTLKRCLDRDQHRRPSAVELLDDRDPFLNPVELADDDAFPMTEELLGRILQNVALKCKGKAPSDADLLVAWPRGYLTNLRQKLKEGRPL